MRAQDRSEARAQAQRWFTDPLLQPVSAAYDARETAASRELAIGALIARYRALHGRQPRTLLDVSCGGGELLASASRMLPDCELFGIDVSPGAVALSRERVPSATVRVRAAEDAHAYDGWPAMDAAIVHLSLGLWSDPAEGLGRIVAQLSDAAVLFVADLGRGDIDTLPNETAVDAYLRDQLAASFTAVELQQVLGAAAGEAKVTVGTEGLCGLDPNDPVTATILRDPMMADVLRSLSSHGACRSDAPMVLYGWLDQGQESRPLDTDKSMTSDRLGPPSGGINFGPR